MSSHYVPNTRIPTLVFSSSTQVARHAALIIEKLIRENNAAGKATVLGLATGSTPMGLYRELIRMHREEGLDFSRVISFNLDEYYPLAKEDTQSYHTFMHDNLFKHINIKPENIHIPNGEVKPEEIDDFCLKYEQAIRRAGGLDVQILGIGRTGHIGFNEPGSTRTCRTRLVTLDPITRRDAAAGFFGEENVPHRAITMGVGTIMDSRKVLLMAYGEHKARIVQRTLENDLTEAVPASFLQRHQDATFLLDTAAAGELTAYRRPWEVGPIKWTPEQIRHAVIWLSRKAKKALLKLSEDDFREHHLYDLLRDHGPAEALGERIFLDRQATICTHPAGRERQTVLVFSPHPDDDVISMGGTMLRLVEQGHDVRVAYMTSGNIAVFDHDAWRFTDFMDVFNRAFGIDKKKTDTIRKRVRSFLDSKRAGQPDSEDVLQIKQLIRETEARAAAAACGILADQCEFLNLRFYRTGTKTKAPLHPDDIADIVTLFERVQPAQIYVAGEMSDPHGTHRMCAEAIFQAVRQVRTKGQSFEVWLYRGAWEEWEPHEIERVVPLSTETLEKKKLAIFRHQSQKDRAMYPGSSDPREFWQRAEERNKATAAIYDQLGLPEFFALEGFVRWKE
ncbi:glucosamine-6-phosphate deaminase : Glucosamine-6-phosphate deaminase-like protein OS=Planctomyces maris DSM 8797 GN=PM8797T_00694 PE=4 SV=1: Glucosamine_iso: PIG-L [Tuwongella immobilis]|uniref:Glucosamine-6-phosphate deaminase n=2 Tax=Tuwongella immobilis TaxID=692036 RepID=A0A6C2YRR7_9BACT|nr:glucosamine-6-phosphate deaminase : Glucosamine-6-phosphate deaminase-like protein OS=Planctomyces maris DSM 8797 GN=PM8797T_00694 PE=4 SV=1: Glucosamine_iso: PIG-L [Tuwongella immobilis]VTS05435.1 glucosamine-6-phosphate deaminase : Glucosamine-6-phosphate deaminase-like protein OS=Planctomyces maris DSM 8797 GN=PM8797T_00694 PE=4 SV=1: Glucosamine_iso: PIG-L [Tuwongella immobilis]